MTCHAICKHGAASGEASPEIQTSMTRHLQAIFQTSGDLGSFEARFKDNYIFVSVTFDILYYKCSQRKQI